MWGLEREKSSSLVGCNEDGRQKRRRTWKVKRRGGTWKKTSNQTAEREGERGPRKGGRGEKLALTSSTNDAWEAGGGGGGGSRRDRKKGEMTCLEQTYPWRENALLKKKRSPTILLWGERRLDRRVEEEEEERQCVNVITGFQEFRYAGRSGEKCRTKKDFIFFSFLFLFSAERDFPPGSILHGTEQARPLAPTLYSLIPPSLFLSITDRHIHIYMYTAIHTVDLTHNLKTLQRTLFITQNGKRDEHSF